VAVTAPPRPPAAPVAAPRATAGRPSRPTVIAGLLGLLGGAAIVAVALIARGGQRPDPEAGVEIALILGGGVLAAFAVARTPGRRWVGGVSLALFGAFAAYTALSIGWSVFPPDSWLEANRTLAYLAVFAGGIALARLAPNRPGPVIGAIAVGCVGVALVAVGSKVLPEALAQDEIFGRLRDPFDYWNACGLMAALGVPACLWAGSRRDGHGAWSALAYPGAAILLATVLLAFSRGSLLALGVGLLVWFAASPVRLRGAAVLIAGLAGGGIIAAWTFARPALTEDTIVLPDRAAAGHQLLVLVLFVVLVLLAFGLAVNFWRAHEPLRGGSRRKIGLALAGVVAAAAIGGVLAVALAPGGFGHAWHELTDPDAKVPKNDPGRLTAAGSIRARYWNDGFRIWHAHELKGAGAGGFATARQRYSRGSELRVSHAHGWIPQTLSDLGLIGLALSLALLGAWGWAALQAAPLGGDRARRAPPRLHAATLTLLATALVFGVHSLVDWTWFVPATAGVGMLAAGWVAGRGRLDAPLTPPSRLRVLGPATVGAALVLLLVVLSAWAVVQPVRARHRADRSLQATDAGKVGEARRTAREAAQIDPLSPRPYFALAAADVEAGDEAGGRAALTKAVGLAPASADGWRRLGEFELDVANRPRAALAALGAALRLDQESEVVERAFVRARRQAMNPAPSATSAPDSGSSP
jgi:O-Antigen ligase